MHQIQSAWQSRVKQHNSNSQLLGSVKDSDEELLLLWEQHLNSLRAELETHETKVQQEQRQRHQEQQAAKETENLLREQVHSLCWYAHGS